MIVVTGIGGTGKSALIEALRRRIERMREAAGEALNQEEIASLSGGAHDRALRKRQALQRSDGLETSVLEEAAEVAQTETSPEDLTSSPDLTRASFANAEFRRLAAAAPDLIRQFLNLPPDAASVEDDALDLSHPVCLASLATLAPSAEPSSRTQIEGVLADCLWI